MEPAPNLPSAGLLWPQASCRERSFLVGACKAQKGKLGGCVKGDLGVGGCLSAGGCQGSEQRTNKLTP
jgi:hypothetical protein